MPDVFGGGDHVYCVGCISHDAVMVLPLGTTACPTCGGKDLMSEADYEHYLGRQE